MEIQKKSHSCYFEFILYDVDLIPSGKDYQIKVDCNVEDCRTNALLGRLGVPNVNRKGIVNANTVVNANGNRKANVNVNGFGGRRRGQNRRGIDYWGNDGNIGNYGNNGNNGNIITGQYGASFAHKISPWSMVIGHVRYWNYI